MKRDFFYWTWIFLGLSFFGWVWEVCLYLIREGRFINRGFLMGPWLPIYGLGGIVLAFTLHRCWKRPFLVFGLSLSLGTIIEYLAGWYLEKNWGIKWWDYSGNKWNLQGRVCLTSSLLFGFSGMLLVCVAVPVYTACYEKIPHKIRRALGLLLLTVFIIDAAYSAIVPHAGTGITYR